jgi:hypothetical protein
VPLPRAGHLDAPFKNRLNAIESLFADNGLEIVTARDPELRHGALGAIPALDGSLMVASGSMRTRRTTSS